MGRGIKIADPICRSKSFNTFFFFGNVIFNSPAKYWQVDARSNLIRKGKFSKKKGRNDLIDLCGKISP